MTDQQPTLEQFFATMRIELTELLANPHRGWRWLRETRRFVIRCNLLEREIAERMEAVDACVFSIGFDPADEGSAVVVARRGNTIDTTDVIVISERFPPFGPLPFKVWCRHCDQEFSVVPWLAHDCPAKPRGHGAHFTTDETQRLGVNPL